MERRCTVTLATLALAASTHAVDTTLIDDGSTWKYLDDGSNQGVSWRSNAFDDSTWASGPAQLGYGDNDEATRVSFGPSSANKYTTTYFRQNFNVTDPNEFISLRLELLRDDGAVVYINGTEVARSNMPGGVISYTTFAASTVGGSSEDIFNTIVIDPAVLQAGSNTIAVEVHQRSLTSSDISFDMRLIGSDTVSILRGPYLQCLTPTSVTIQWRTDSAVIGVVRYGVEGGPLDQTVQEPGAVSDHIVELNGLDPLQTYTYSIGTPSDVVEGGTADYVFTTAPPIGTRKPSKFWVVGDSGTANSNAAAVYQAYLDNFGSTPTDSWLMLGDNAYNDGTDSEYQAAVFDMYPELLRNTALWSTLGNHDGRSADSASQTGVYYDIFTHPTAAEAGGLASGTEAFYSFDYANVHFVCLDSFESNRSTTGPMLTWLESDLASTTQDWIVAFWHHPPYTKGSHNSDTENTLIDMRQNALPMLEDAGVDLVLCGHSHSYERSFLIDGHYGSSSEIVSNPSLKLDGASGNPNTTGEYVKATNGIAPHEGTVYVVAGSSGQISGGSLNHPAMFVSLNQLGSLVLEVDGLTMLGTFLTNTGATNDVFQITKGSGCKPDLDNNGDADINDLLAFIADWFNDDADYNADAITDINDLLAFIADWFAGC